MSMAVGPKGGQNANMNVTPLIDVLLVLLIIFMVITPLTPKGLEALVPQPPPKDQKQPPPTDRTIVVQLIDRGSGNTPGVKINQDDDIRTCHSQPQRGHHVRQAKLRLIEPSECQRIAQRFFRSLREIRCDQYRPWFQSRCDE